ncbi:MAG TPA: NAD(P)/FAD-dependent oxidoreductase [Chloroflexi bacterium]|nr:NAD(P)/FAD-dependent oxidoreductase [Chloroflexota bacterium]
MPSPRAGRASPPVTRRYVVLGNGIAGQTAAEELRKLDADASIVMIAAERHPLYNRVALPRYLRGQVRREKVFMRTAEDYTRQNLDIHFETWATEVDFARKVVRTNRDQEFEYDALLIATGGRPKPPPWPGSDQLSQAIGFQTLDDTDAIIEKADAAERVLVMGGSFIGYELAEGVSFRKKAQLTWIMRGPWFLRYVLDEEGGQLCRQMGEAQGVEFITSDEVQKFSRSNGRFLAETVNGKRVEFDVLTYGVGLDYYTEPVRDSVVKLDKGIVTDAKLRASAPDVYAAGDIAVFYDLMVERHNQMGTWDNAEAHGKVAARNMAGGDEDFFDVPTYTTTMFGSTLAVMGVTPDVQPDLESVRTYSLDEKFYRKLFFKDDRLVGAIMIGPPKGRKKLIEIMRSRQRIERPKQELLDPNNLKD